MIKMADKFVQLKDANGNNIYPIGGGDINSIAEVSTEPLTISHGGTGATTAADARDNLGVGNIHFKTKTVTNYQFTANQYRSISVTCPTLDGYTPIVIATYCTNKSAIRVFNSYVSGNNIKFEAVSQSSATITDASFATYLLYIKDTFLVNE